MDLLSSPSSKRMRQTTVAVIAFCVAGFVTSTSAHAQVSSRAVVRDSAFQAAKPVFSWREIKNRNIVMQQRDYSCGAAALATLLRYYWGYDVNEPMVLGVVENMLSSAQLRDREREGLTMADVSDAAKEMGFLASVGEVSFADLTGSKVPLIVVVDIGGTNHFVVYRGVAAGCVFLADPLRGNLRISASHFQQTWQQNAVLVVAPEGKTESSRSQLGIRHDEVVRGYLNRQPVRRATTAGLRPNSN